MLKCGICGKEFKDKYCGGIRDSTKWGDTIICGSCNNKGYDNLNEVQKNNITKVISQTIIKASSNEAIVLIETNNKGFYEIKCNSESCDFIHLSKKDYDEKIENTKVE